MKKLTLITLAILLLSTLAIVLMSSCVKEPQTTEHHGDFKVSLLFEKDGCKVYRFYDGGMYVYWSNCEGRTDYTYSDGKHSYRMQTINSTR